MLEGEPLQARGPCEEAVRIAREVGEARVECDALNTLGAVLAILGAPEDGIEVLRRGKRLAEELGALQELRRAYINLGQSLDHAGRLEEAVAVAREGWERLRPRIGTPAVFLAAEAGGRLRRLGRWDEALAFMEEAAETARPHWTTGLLLAELVVLQALRGDFERAGANLKAVVELRGKGDPHWPSTEATAAAALGWARGDAAGVPQVVALDNPIWQSDSAFDVPRFAYALSAEADLARRARDTGDEAAERDAVARARALLDRVHALTAPDRPLGHTPQDVLLEVEWCELEATRAAGETSADAWAAHAGKCRSSAGRLMPPMRACAKRKRRSPRTFRVHASPRPLPAPGPPPRDSVHGRF
jgi:tetratricopeptide (TPR) repeat protein